MEPVRRQARGGAAGSWEWSGSAARRRALLDAGQEVFAERGFATASITEIAQRAGSSVGSLCYHFGGKAELFLALWQEHHGAHQEAVSRAFTAARERGAAEPFELFAACVQAALEVSWQRRELALLFLREDTIPGFNLMKRQAEQEWIERCHALLGGPESASDRIYAGIVTALIDEGAREVAAAASRRQANLVIDATIGYLERITAGARPG